jgi:hypothetical protein
MLAQDLIVYAGTGAFLTFEDYLGVTEDTADGAVIRFAADQSVLLAGVLKASLVKENLGFFDEEV